MRVIVLLSILLGAAVPSSLQAQEIDELVARVASSVVGIGALTKSLPQRGSQGPVRFFGSGFVLEGGGRVASSWHVVDNELGPTETLVVFAGQGQEVRAYAAQLAQVDRSHDLAILELVGAGNLLGLSLADGALLAPGRSVAFTGFPTGILGGIYPVTHRGMVSAIVPAARPVRSAENLSAMQLRARKSGYMTYQLDAEVLPGQSGSPVYDIEKGKVVAVVQGSLSASSPLSDSKLPSRISFAVPVRYLNALLEP